MREGGIWKRTDRTALDSRSTGPALTVEFWGAAFDSRAPLAVPAVHRLLKPDPKEYLVGHLYLEL